MRIQNRVLKFITRLIVSIGLIVWLLKRVDISELIITFKSASFLPLFSAYALVILVVCLSAWRWSLLISSQNIKVPYRLILNFYFVSLFFNLFLPTGFGGDFVRAYKLNYYTDRLKEAISSILVERIIGLYSLLLIALIGSLFSLKFIRNYQIHVAIWTLAMFSLIGTFVFLNSALRKKINLFIQRFTFKKIGNNVSEFIEHVYGYKFAKIILLKVFSISIISQMIMIFSMYLFGISIDAKAKFFLFLIFVPIVGVLQLLPLSIGGLGIREGVYLYLFTNAGVLPAHGLLISLLFTSAIFLEGLIGGLLHLLQVTLFSRYPILNNKQCLRN